MSLVHHLTRPKADGWSRKLQFYSVMLVEQNINSSALNYECTGIETNFTKKFLVNFTSNFKELASNIELNVKFWSRKTEIVFSCKNVFQ